MKKSVEITPKLDERCAVKSVRTKKFYRLPATHAGCQLVLNVNNTTIAKIRDNKTVHSWTAKRPHWFTSPVVYDETNNTLCCVLDYVTVVRWQLCQDDFEKAEKLKFNEPIFTVIPVVGGRTMVIFKSGKYHLHDWTHATNVSQISDLQLHSVMLWAEACTIKDKTYVLIMALKNKKYICCSFVIEGNTGVPSTFYSDSIVNCGASLKCWCLYERPDVCLLTIWSDGSILVFPRDYQRGSARSMLSISGVRPEHRLEMGTTKDCHLVLAKGSPDTNELCVQVYDLNFGALKIHSTLKATYHNYLQLFVPRHGSSIYVVSGRRLLTIPLPLKKSTLANAIGKSISVPPEPLKYLWDSDQHFVEVKETKTGIKESCDVSITAKAQRLLSGKPPVALNHIHEEDLVELLLFAIWKKYNSDAQDSSTCDPNDLLSVILCSSYSDMRLVFFLKQLSPRKILDILKELAEFLENGIPVTNASVKIPSEVQIIDWMLWIMQTCHEAMAFHSRDPETSQFIKDVTELIREKRTGVKHRLTSLRRVMPRHNRYIDAFKLRLTQALSGLARSILPRPVFNFCLLCLNKMSQYI